MSNIGQFIGSNNQAAILDGLWATGGIFGNGEDGAATISADTDGSYLNLGSKQYTNLTIDAGFSLQTTAGNDAGGIFIRCSGTLTIAGNIKANGAAGGDAASNASGAGGAGAGGAAAEASVTGDTAGGDSNTPDTAGAAGAGASGASGACANTSGSQSGGKEGTTANTTLTTARLNTYFSLANELNMSNFAHSLGTAKAYSAAALAATVDFTSLTYRFTPQCVRGAGGGGGGGAQYDTEAAAAGGGGGGAGAIVIAARNIVWTAGHEVECKGGDGGTAWAAGSAGDAGGGAGGNGGFALFVCESTTGTPSISVAGGAAGAKVNAGIAGEAGNAGQYVVLKV